VIASARRIDGTAIEPPSRSDRAAAEEIGHDECRHERVVLDVAEEELHVATGHAGQERRELVPRFEPPHVRQQQEHEDRAGRTRQDLIRLRDAPAERRVREGPELRVNVQLPHLVVRGVKAAQRHVHHELHREGFAVRVDEPVAQRVEDDPAREREHGADDRRVEPPAGRRRRA
jgi:hypothetical protein